MFSRYVAHVFSELLWNSPSRPYYYWYHLCFYIPHKLYFYCKVFIIIIIIIIIIINLTMFSTIKFVYCRWQMNKIWIWRNRRKIPTGENPRTRKQLNLGLLCSPQIQHRVVGDVSRSSMMTGRQQTTWASIYYEWSICYEAGCPRYKRYHGSTSLCKSYESFCRNLHCSMVFCQKCLISA